MPGENVGIRVTYGVEPGAFIFFFLFLHFFVGFCSYHMRLKMLVLYEALSGALYSAPWTTAISSNSEVLLQRGFKALVVFVVSFFSSSLTLTETHSLTQLLVLLLLSFPLLLYISVSLFRRFLSSLLFISIYSTLMSLIYLWLFLSGLLVVEKLEVGILQAS